MNIPRLILKKLREEPVGRPNAIKRRDLLNWLHEQGEYAFHMERFSDREMRAIIETMPVICSCETGYYIPREGEEGEADVKHAIAYIEKKSWPLLQKVRDKKKTYPQYFQNKNQGELPYEDNDKPIYANRHYDLRFLCRIFCALYSLQR